MSDIILSGPGEPDVVTVAASNLRVLGHDLALDSQRRRLPGGPKHRRALVHDENDGLTINFSADYPGGVTVNGQLEVTGKLVVKAVEVALPPTVVGHRTNPISGQEMPILFFNAPIDLGDEIASLRSALEDLKARLAQMESNQSPK